MKTLDKLCIIVAALAAFAPLAVRADVEVGKAAPDFTLTDIAGQPHRLSDYRGKTVVLEWVNPECPIASRHYSSRNMQETQKAALEKGCKVGVTAPGEALFWPAHVYGRSTPAVAARMDNFLNLYGFCRNTALVCLIDASVLYWSYLQPKGPHEHLLWARISLIVSIGMTLRYLKFFRHFALEVFTSWAFSKEPEKKA